MPYIGNITSDFSVDTGNITNRAVTATKLSPSSVGSNGQVLSVDGSGNLQWGNDANAPEGTAVLSTGESGTTKFLRIDGDGTCSWQVPPNTQLSFSNDANNRVVTGTGSGLNGEANLTFNGISLGIGVSASTFSLGNALQIEGAGVGVWGENTSTIHLFSNAYYNGGYKYGVTAPAGQYQIYQNTHQWAIAASGTADAALTWVQAMKIDSSGRLLIGTTTEGNESADELTINSTTNTGITIRSGENHNGSIFFSDTTSGADEYRGFVQYDQQNDNLKLGCATEAIVWLHADKKLSVGYDANSYGQWSFLNIGSTGADATGGDKGLCIRSDTGATNNSVLSNSAFTLKLNNNGYAGTGVSGNQGTVVKLLFNGVTSNGWNSYGAIGLDTQGTDGSKGDLFFNTGGTTNGSEIMRIKYTGKVGIGTETPSTVLEVAGTNETTFDHLGTLTLRGTDAYDSGNAGAGIMFAGKYQSGGNSTTLAQISGIKEDTGDGTYDGALTFGVRNDAEGVNIERMRISSAGKVGIGTTSPDYNLDIRAASGDTWVSVRGGTNQGYQVRKTDNTLIGYYGNGGGVNLGVNDNAIAAPAGSLRFQTGGTAAANERFLIDSAGNIECKRGGIDAIPPFQIYGSGNAGDAVADNLRIHNWGDANGDYWQLGSNLGMDANGNNVKPSTTLKGAAVNIDGRGGRIFLKTSSSNTSTVNEGFVMNEVGHITKPNQPCFCAEKNGTGSTPNTTNATQIFQTENFDIGNNYDNTTGIFTAPVAGKYFFYVQMLTNSTDTRCLLFFNKNNSSNVMEISATSQNYNSIKSSIFISLAANDTMRVNNHSSSTHTKLYADSSYQNQFMGWLVC